LHYFQIKYVIRWLGLPCFVLTLGCAPLQVKDGTLSPPHKNYTVTIPGKGWELVKAGKEDVALWHKQYHAMIAFISSDIENKKVSLKMLNNQLFIGMKNKKILLNEPMLVDNQKALHTIVESEMDNCKLKINSYVIKVGDKVYDLVCWSPSDSFSSVQGDFESMVRNFKFTRREEPLR
jgi:hypothetical protein